MSYVLTHLTKEELSNYIDDKAIEILSYFIKHSLFAKPEILPDQDKIKLEIPKTYVEQWLGGLMLGLEITQSILLKIQSE